MKTRLQLVQASAAVMRPLEALFPKDPYVELMRTQVSLVPSTLDAERLVRHSVKLATEPGPHGRVCNSGSVLNHIQAVAQLMRSVAPKDTSQLTERDLRLYFQGRDRTRKQLQVPVAQGWMDDGLRGFGLLAPKSLRYHKLFVRKYFADIFGAEKAADLLTMGDEAAGSYRKANAYTWLDWEDIRRVRESLKLPERALLDALMTGPRLNAIRNLRIDQVRFQDGWCYLTMPPDNFWEHPRTIPYHHGDETMGAHLRLLRRSSPNATYVFPNPDDATQPMTTKQLTSLVATWGRRHDMHLAPKQLRDTYLAYLLARGVGEQYIAHITGSCMMDPIYHLARQVKTAGLQNRPNGLPVTAVPEVAAGYVPCIACGKQDNAQNNQVCGTCGHPLSDAPLATQAVLQARIMHNVRELLQITGQTETQRVRAALAAARAGQETNNE